MNTPSPVVSVVLSTHNDGRFIKASVDSILDQTLKDMELIIVDDASTDQTSQILESYVTRDSRVSVIHTSKNLGLTKSLNIGLSRARAPYIARQDGDDISVPDRLERQVAFLNAHPEIDLIGASRVVMDEHGTEVSRRKALSGRALIGTLPRANCFSHTSLMFRRGPIYREKFYYAQDYDFVLRLLSAKRGIENLEDFLVKWRRSTSAISYAKRFQQDAFAQVARKMYLARARGEDDGYDSFDPSMIMRQTVKIFSASAFLLKDQLVEHLKAGDFAVGRELLRDSPQRLTLPLQWMILFSIFFRAPLVYRIYYAFRYGKRKS